MYYLKNTMSFIPHGFHNPETYMIIIAGTFMEFMPNYIDECIKHGHSILSPVQNDHETKLYYLERLYDCDSSIILPEPFRGTQILFENDM